MKYIFLLLLLNSCGFNGTQKLETNDSTQIVRQDGTSFTYVIIRMEFLQQINQFCIDANPIDDFISESLQKKAIANCTLEHMNLLNISVPQVNDFNNNYCTPNADLSSLSPQQQQQVLDACNTLTIL